MVDGFIEAGRFLHGEHVFERRFLPYSTQLIPLAAVLTVAGNRAEDAGPRDLLRRWFWCGVFGELYGSATETRFANDLVDFTAWLEDDEALPRTVLEANLSPERFERLRTRNSAAYRGIYVLLLREQVRDWRTGETANIQSYYEESVDIHHVFPRKWCRDNGVDDTVSNSILNKTPLTARTNRIIGGAAPSAYLQTLQDKAGASPDTVDAWLATHLIAPDTLREDEFDLFWEERRTRMLDRIAAVMGKQLRPDEQDLLAEDELDDEESA